MGDKFLIYDLPTKFVGMHLIDIEILDHCTHIIHNKIFYGHFEQGTRIVIQAYIMTKPRCNAFSFDIRETSGMLEKLETGNKRKAALRNVSLLVHFPYSYTYRKSSSHWTGIQPQLNWSLMHYNLDRNSVQSNCQGIAPNMRVLT